MSMCTCIINRVMKDDVPLVIVTKELTKQTRHAFLGNPPKQFLFLEEAQDGTRVYLPEHPGGALLKGASVWQLSGFVNLLAAGGQKLINFDFSGRMPLGRCRVDTGTVLVTVSNLDELRQAG